MHQSFPGLLTAAYADKSSRLKRVTMSKLLRGLAAGYGAKKLGGGCGCFGVAIVFIILWFVLGNFNIFQ